MNLLIEALKKEYPANESLTRPQIQSVSVKYGLKKEFTEFMTNPVNKIQRGLYRNYIEKYDVAVADDSAEAEMARPKKAFIQEDISEQESLNPLIPKIDSGFVGFGDFNLLKKIVKSDMFFPVYIAGESGNGKTKMVYQACAVSGRELIRANITETTDEDDLIGGYRLVNGETVWQDGPAIAAMKSGSILLLDEINLASPKIMCLQPILEGNPIYIKKTNTTVFPKKGFNVVATANTKGKSSDDGRYIGSNTLNEALLDRFALTFEHEYPPDNVEVEILNKILQKSGSETAQNKEFVDKLVKWAKIIRETYNAGGVDEIITTRRLIHILQCVVITNMSRIRAIKYCISRFDDETKKSFYSLYQKVDETVDINANGQIIDKDNDAVAF